jgi:hypothetical protein
MLSLRRLNATVLLLMFLVVSFGMFSPPAFSSACDIVKSLCCDDIRFAQDICSAFGSADELCKLALRIARMQCAVAAVICGSIVAHDCFGG